MSVTSLAEPFVNMGQGLIEGILGPGQTLLGFGEGYNVFTPIITFTPFLLGLIVLQFLIAFWFPTFKGRYSQTDYSQFAQNLIIFRSFLWSAVALASTLFVWIPLIYKALRLVKEGEMVSTYYFSLDVILTVLLLAFMFFIASAFTKWFYGGLTVTANSSNVAFGLAFYHCETDPASKESTDDSVSTCKRTRWQSSRDAFLSAVASYFGALLSGVNVVVNPYAFTTLIVAGLLAALT